MLKVKTYITTSPIPNAGIGLFAKEFIPKGSWIWEFTPDLDRIYTENEFNAASQELREFLTTYCFKYKGEYYLCNDNARFFNHSDTPNCQSVYYDSGVGVTISTRDIEAGEELTDNYAAFGVTDDDKLFNVSF